MARCVYCGQSAGLFRNKHKECVEKHEQGWASMVKMACDCALGIRETASLEGELRALAATSYIPTSDLNKALVAGFEQAIDHVLDDRLLDEEEEKRLGAFAKAFGLGQSELDANGAWTRMVKAAVLRDLSNGIAPQRVHVTGTLPFNFMTSEHLIWIFSGVQYYEDRVQRQYVGGYQGVSIRIAKGVYYRTGGFRGRPVETTSQVLLDTGTMAVTNKHLYFAGGSRSFRIRHEKIVTLQPYTDGITIVRDAASARPQTFVTGDGWFTHNLLSNARNVGQ